MLADAAESMSGTEKSVQICVHFAARNGVALDDVEPCQSCGAPIDSSVHECMEILELGFGGLDLTSPRDHAFGVTSA